MSLKLVTALLVPGLIALSTASAPKPLKSDSQPIPNVYWESAKTAEHEKMSLGLYWGTDYTMYPIINNASVPRFTSGPEVGCNTVEQDITWPLLEVYWESSTATSGEEIADGSASARFGRTLSTASFTTCKENNEYELEMNVSSPLENFDLYLYEMETLRDEFLKPAVLDSLKAKIRTVLRKPVEKYLTAKLPEQVEMMYSKRYLRRFTKQLVEATPEAFPALDLSR